MVYKGKNVHLFSINGWDGKMITMETYKELSFLAMVTCSLLVMSCNAQLEELDLPPDLHHCHAILWQNSNNNATAEYGEPTDAECLHYILLKGGSVTLPGLNITQKDIEYFKGLSRSLVHRSKRQAVRPGRRGRGRYWPMTGYRIRREYRRLREGERQAFHAALNALKQQGEYDTFANLHQGTVVTSAHGGPNFLGWHRVFLALFEEALRRVNPRVFLPYWDSSLDFDMANPADSILWSPGFLGNGDGFVTTGPFANWQTPVGPLTRNVAAGSRLLSKGAIRQVLSRCRTREISTPTAQPQFDLELIHGGPHIWVGGQMSGLNTAAHDPVFFLHHAFIDYIWEIFRVRQTWVCCVNPNRDYPDTPGQHAADRFMDGLPNYRNIDGYASYWTRFWYNYERSPRCNRFYPYCGSPHLRCDTQRQVCVSQARMAAAAPEMARAGFAASSAASVARGRAQAASIRVGPLFRAPSSDGRTQDAAGSRPGRMMFSGRIGLLGLQF